MRVDLFGFDLPEDRIALRPAEPRDAARMLVVCPGAEPPFEDHIVRDLPDLKAEFNAEPHVRGVCSMARTNNPHSANSQFFICFEDARFLDKQYTVWGKVVEGMENVDKIKRGEPVRDPDRIVSMKVMADAA